MVKNIEDVQKQFEHEFGSAPYFMNMVKYPSTGMWAEEYTNLTTQYAWEGYRAGYITATNSAKEKITG